MKYAPLFALMLLACGQPHSWPSKKNLEGFPQQGDQQKGGDEDEDLVDDNNRNNEEDPVDPTDDDNGPTPGDDDDDGGETANPDLGDVQCEPCSSDDDCGDGITAGCWLGDEDEGFCAYDCTEDEDACPNDTSCELDDWGYGTCVPDGGLCEGQSDNGGGGDDDLPDTQCDYCSDDSDCGDGVTAGCWLTDGVDDYCAIDCTFEDICPSGTYCDHDGEWGVCIPDEGICE